MKRRDFGRRLVGWFTNTTIDPDKIMDHLGVTRDKNKRDELRKVALAIRKEEYTK